MDHVYTAEKMYIEPSVEFVGWQRNDLNNHVPLFLLSWKGHPLNRSLIDANTVLRLGIEIPEIEPCSL